MKRLEMKIAKLYYTTSTRNSYKILIPRENIGNARTLTLSITFCQVHCPIPLAKSCPNKWKTTMLDGNEINNPFVDLYTSGHFARHGKYQNTL